MELLPGRPGWPRVLLERADAGASDIAAAEAGGAWAAWRSATAGLTPEAIIAAVESSGLRGRGGSGYPTAQKWRACAAADGAAIVVANGFEADPGAQIDRTLMELDPHGVVEGALLAAYAVGAGQVIIVVGAGATRAADRLRAAVEAATDRGYLGGDAGIGAGIDVSVQSLSGSFVTGEETVLLRALEQRRAQPDQRPPFPSERGLWGRPTLVNNVETLAAVPWIVRTGGDRYAAIGAAGSPGTTLIQLTGAVKRPGIVEAPMGVTLRELVDGVGGGCTGTLKAVLVGGPAGGFLPPDALDTRLGYTELAEAGASNGSGSLLVIDTTSCVVDLAALLTRYLSDAACGKTIPCRIGTRRLAELGDGFCTGRCDAADRDLVAALSDDIRDAALCGLEIGAVDPLRSGMRYFGQEFDDHITRGSCEAGVCHPIRVAAAGAARS